MCDMRRLASLFICLQEECHHLNGSHKVEVKDMVRHSNFPALQLATHHYITSEAGMKANLKASMHCLLNKLAKIVKSSYFVSQN